MKQAVNFVLALFGTVVVLGLNSISGCSAPDNFGQLACDPNAFLPDPWCRNAADAGPDPDAGTDADTDVSDTDASSAVDDPDMNTSYWDNCKTGHCFPAPIGSEAGLWSDEPISLWIGPVDQVPAKCPDDPVYGVPNEIFSLFDQLVAPPATCSACSCGPSEGTCSGVPETLELRAGTCAQSGVVTVPFDAPAGWDGSCTNADTIAAGAKCPAGSQTLCTQSVHSSALPAPADACQPSVSAPSLIPETSWEIGALACKGIKEEAERCGVETLKLYCVNDPGPAWLQCTYRGGVHEKCPDNYQYARHVLYPKEPIDNRGCSACECGAPMGSACKGGLRLSSDGACGPEVVTLQVGSIGPMCYNFLVPGEAIGSKAIVNRAYLPGACAVSGGESVGSATADVAEAITFCCMAPWVGMEPPH